MVKLKGSRGTMMLDKGTVCMFAGYPHDHDNDSFKMWDPTTGTLHVGQDVIWLQCMFHLARVPELGPLLAPFTVNNDADIIWPPPIDHGIGGLGAPGGVVVHGKAAGLNPPAPDAGNGPAVPADAGAGGAPDNSELGDGSAI